MPVPSPSPLPITFLGVAIAYANAQLAMQLVPETLAEARRRPQLLRGHNETGYVP
jgi:hypothetical protein